MSSLLYISSSATGVKISRYDCRSLWFKGSTFACGFVADAPVSSAIVAYPDLDGGQAHLMAFCSELEQGVRRPSGNNFEIGLILFSSNDRGDKIIAYTLDGGEGSVREFTGCNQFISHGSYLSVADTDRNILYVTMIPAGRVAAGWTYKRVPFEAILKYIVKRTTLEELDATAESEQRARDELAELAAAVARRNSNCQELVDEVGALHRECRMAVARAASLEQTLNRFANWVERMLLGPRATVFGQRAPNTTAVVLQVLRDRKLGGGITLAGLINGRADPVD